MDRALKIFEKIIVSALIVMMVVVISLATLELGWIIFRDITDPSNMLLEINELLDIFGFFLLVLIGIELLETINAYLVEHVVHVEIVLEVALIAVARKVIILDPKEYAPVTLLSIAALIVTLAIAIYIEQRARLATPLIPRTDTTSRSDTTPSQERETRNS
jgi:uncharacterized membrane protein (DUF373 family)